MNPPMRGFLRRQPGKALYLAYEVITTGFIRVPLYIVLSIPKAWRPVRSWGIKRAFMLRLMRHLTVITNKTGPIFVKHTHLAISEGRGIKGAWVEPVPQLITGKLAEWATFANVVPVRIPGYWLDQAGTDIEVNAKARLGEKIIYALHGGAYFRLSAHPSDPTAQIAQGLLKYIPELSRVFTVEYRLSSTTPDAVENPYPAALLDALAGYHYLVTVLHFPPSNIVVEGDSAGGNLALALVRYLVEYRNDLSVILPEPPGAVILTCPWADLCTSHDNQGSALDGLITDFIGENESGIVDYARDAFLGPHSVDAALANPYISPVSVSPSMKDVSFKGWPRTFILAGGAEYLLDQVRTLKMRMIRDMGEGNGLKEGEGSVRYYEAKDSVHDFLALDWQEPERSEAFGEIAEWVRTGFAAP